MIPQGRNNLLIEITSQRQNFPGKVSNNKVPVNCIISKLTTTTTNTRIRLSFCNHWNFPEFLDKYEEYKLNSKIRDKDTFKSNLSALLHVGNIILWRLFDILQLKHQLL